MSLAIIYHNDSVRLGQWAPIPTHAAHDAATRPQNFRIALYEDLPRIDCGIAPARPTLSRTLRRGLVFAGILGATTLFWGGCLYAMYAWWQI